MQLGKLGSLSAANLIQETETGAPMDKPDHNRHLITTPWRATLTVTAIAMLVLAITGSLDEPGRSYADASLKRALVTFGIARALNGVISVAQGTEVALQPAGFGLTLAPGEILDPANDLVERFSSLMLVAATSLGIQRVLLDVAVWRPVTLALGIALMGSLICLWHRLLAKTRFARGVWALAALTLLIRFAAPFATVVSAGAFEKFLAPRYAKATAELEGTNSKLRALTKETYSANPTPEQGIIDRAWRAFDAAGEALNFRKRIKALTDAAANVADYTLELIVVFVIETILMPLVFLWLLLAAVRRIATWGLR